MQTQFYPASARGSADFGWLQAKHSFSFGQWYNPKQVHFGALRVLNDDIVQGGGGFPTHPHDNMEIITIPLQGALQHKDSTGGEGVINKNDVQIMSAGTGVQHSEFNASATELVNLLQLWIFPKEKNITPRYNQKTFSDEERMNKWQTVVSPTDATALWINQDASIALVSLEAGREITYNIQQKGNGVYFFTIEGNIIIAQNELQKRDAIGVWDVDAVNMVAKEATELLAIEVPMLLP